MTSTESLQSRLDEITAQTRSLVQPERLAIMEAHVAELFATGIEDRMLQPGSVAPEFALPDATTGKLVRSADLLAMGPLVITFFRGRWCPYDMTELMAWQEAYAEVREHGAFLVGISPQLQRQNDFTAGQHRITFPLLTDTGCTLAEKFGIAYALPEPMQHHYRSMLVNIPFINGDATWRLPLAATFVLDSDRVVRFAAAYADHRVRPEPSEILALL
ncbi:MAG: peroxiredoxin-like family protein [Acidobacteriaceae bacterium]|nr:peroxiredoxin-like family protein [Acidobacteriaceae bacterium]